MTGAGKRQQRALRAQQRLFRNRGQYGHRPTVTGNDRLRADGGRQSRSMTAPRIAPLSFGLSARRWRAVRNVHLEGGGFPISARWDRRAALAESRRAHRLAVWSLCRGSPSRGKELPLPNPGRHACPAHPAFPGRRRRGLGAYNDRGAAVQRVSATCPCSRDDQSMRDRPLGASQDQALRPQYLHASMGRTCADCCENQEERRSNWTVLQGGADRADEPDEDEYDSDEQRHHPPTVIQYLP